MRWDSIPEYGPAANKNRRIALRMVAVVLFLAGKLRAQRIETLLPELGGRVARDSGATGLWLSAFRSPTLRTGTFDSGRLRTNLRLSTLPLAGRATTICRRCALRPEATSFCWA